MKNNSYQSSGGIYGVQVAVSDGGQDVVGRELSREAWNVVDILRFARALGLALDLRNRLVNLLLNHEL